MSISFAGLGIISLQNPFTELASLLVGKGDIRTMLCLLVFFIVSLVLAYLTNPSENSFRAYLTEQSFRQHLSRLDEHCDDGANKLREGVSRIASPKGTHTTTGHILPFDGSFPFHFANRASISLRTPKHVFHSFGVFTVAAMIPLPKSSIRDDRDSLMISDSWYIGAFGKWWRGGILETWYQDVISRSKDEESWSSGILSMKSLDILQGFTGPAPKVSVPNAFVNGSPPKLRNRERTTCKSAVIAPRSTTPPPLPKSALLPLHTTRVMPTASEQRPLILASHLPPVQAQQPCSSSESGGVGASLLSRSPSVLFDQSPRIAHVLEQINASKASLVDLRAQLHDCQTSTSQTHALLQEEVNSYRERKRTEDAGKLETKLRTKTLEDSKRSAEAIKREADKKFKVAQSAHDHAAQRTRFLDAEMTELRRQTSADEEILQHTIDDVSSTERELLEELEQKKQEIKKAEDIVTALNQRARVLEDQLNDEREKLRNKKRLVESRRVRLLQAFARDSSFIATSQEGFSDFSNSSLDSIGQVELNSTAGFAPYQPHLSIGTQSTFESTSSIDGARQAPYDPFTTSHQGKYSLAGFADEVSRTLGLPVASPTGQSLIPSGLITSLDGSETLGTSRSFQSDNDPYLEKEWREKCISYQTSGQDSCDTHISFEPFSASSPLNISNSSFPSSRRSSLDGHTYPRTHESGHSNETMEGPRNSAPGQWQTSFQADGTLHFDAESMDGNASLEKTCTRRWLPRLPKDKAKKGLNPDAKEFSMSGGLSASTHHSLPSFDNLNPTGIGSSMLSSAPSTSGSLFLRAFAPSPAEREALQRALGGTNTSFERLPSLSDVGSIPSSPSHVHALPSNSHAHKILPSWLPAFPRGRKTQFSPWGDEEPSCRASDDGGRSDNP